MYGLTAAVKKSKTNIKSFSTDKNYYNLTNTLPWKNRTKRNLPQK